MTGRSIPYTYVCRLCGGEDQAENRTGPLRSRCRACMFGLVGNYRKRQSARETSPFISRPAPAKRWCAGCGAALPPAEGEGRPRTFCLTCRPPKTIRSPAVEAKRKTERAEWVNANTFAIKPHLLPRPPTDALAAPRPKTTANICEACGEVFWASKRARHCGQDCRHRSSGGVTRTELLEAKRASSPRYQDHVCGHCGRTFRPKKVDRRKFCSRACAFAAQRAAAFNPDTPALSPPSA